MHSLEEMVAAANRIVGLAERATPEDAKAYEAYHALLFDLHNDTTAATEATRRWLADRGYTVEERHIAVPHDFSPVVPSEFLAWIDGEIRARSRMRHPMSAHLFEGAPTRNEIRRFVQHHWLRSCVFFQLVAEAALRLEGFEDRSALYCNLYDETGEGDPARAHPVLLSRLMEHYDLPADPHARSELTSEQAYLNNRIRCVRHPEPGWGLAILYAIETSTSANHRSIYQMLERAGVPEAACEFHRLHGEVDDGHAAQLGRLIERRAGDPQFQRTVVRSLRHHLELSRRYFDDLWREMQAKE